MTARTPWCQEIPLRLLVLSALLLGVSPSAWAKTLRVPKGSKDPGQLHEELLARFPQWRGEPKPDGAFTNPRLRVEYTDQEVRLEMPDEADGAAVQAVIAAHVPRQRKANAAKKSATMTMQERMDRVEQALGLE